MDKKSTSCACQLLGGKLACWNAKKKSSVAMSSVDAEYVAAGGCCTNPNVPVDKFKSAKDGLGTVHTKIRIEKESMDDQEFNTSSTNFDDYEEINLEDLSKLVKDVEIDTMELDSPEDDQTFIVLTDEDEEFIAIIPTELKELPSKISDLNEAVGGLKQYVKGMEIEIPKKIKNKKIKQTVKTDVTKAEVKKGKEQLIDLVGHEVVEMMYRDKVKYDKYCHKMLNRRALVKISNCDVLSKGKGLITLKVYRDDGTDEIIQNFKASDLYLGEWKEVMNACPNGTGVGWTTIYTYKAKT
nr:retrovirus-related Pol polyprotein from transposon TNT 1-94 [Tanacetum cinerariifolium]